VTAAPPSRTSHGAEDGNTDESKDGAGAAPRSAASGAGGSPAAARVPPAVGVPCDASSVAELLAVLQRDTSVALMTPAVVAVRVAVLRQQVLAGDSLRGLAGLALLYTRAGQHTDAATAALALLLMDTIAPLARVEAGCRLLPMLGLATPPPQLTQVSSCMTPPQCPRSGCLHHAVILLWLCGRAAGSRVGHAAGGRCAPITRCGWVVGAIPAGCQHTPGDQRSAAAGCSSTACCKRGE